MYSKKLYKINIKFRSPLQNVENSLFLWYNKKDQYGMMENLSICILIHGMQKVFQGHAGLTLFGAADKPEKLYII